MQDLAARNQSLEAKLLLKEQELAALAALATKEKRLGKIYQITRATGVLRYAKSRFVSCERNPDAQCLLKVRTKKSSQFGKNPHPLRSILRVSSASQPFATFWVPLPFPKDPRVGKICSNP